jgi:hypothetical protein
MRLFQSGRSAQECDRIVYLEGSRDRILCAVSVSGGWTLQRLPVTLNLIPLHAENPTTFETFDAHRKHRITYPVLPPKSALVAAFVRTRTELCPSRKELP